ncbi:hypothetical protein ABK040_011795 [Willaertia magna]
MSTTTFQSKEEEEFKYFIEAMFEFNRIHSLYLHFHLCETHNESFAGFINYNNNNNNIEKIQQQEQLLGILQFYFTNYDFSLTINKEEIIIDKEQFPLLLKITNNINYNTINNNIFNELELFYFPFFRNCFEVKEEDKIKICEKIKFTFFNTVSKSSGWFDVIICLIISEIIASTFHGVCITTCFLFSIVITYELFQLSNSDKLSSYDQNVVNEGQRKFSKK